MECEVINSIEDEKDAFYNALKEMIDLNADEKCNLPKVGHTVLIEADTCKHNEIPEAYKVESVDYQTGKIFVKEYDYGIDIDKVINLTVA